MWEELAVIADRLDKTGLFAEADELDMILSTAAMPGGPVFSRFRELLDTPEKKNIFKRLLDTFKGKTFTREEVNRLMEEANELAWKMERQTYQRIQNPEIQLVEGIKSLNDDITKLLDSNKSGTMNPSINRAYLDDIMKLSNLLTIFNRMMSGARGPEDIQKALRIKQVAGDDINRAQNLIKGFYNTNVSNFDWKLRFSQIIDNWKELTDKRSKTSRLMTEEQKEAEGTGIKFDPRDSKYISELREHEATDDVIRKDAKQVMSYYDIIALINPKMAKDLESKLGNNFVEVQRLSRDTLRG
jgi:hypothetical protein